MSRCAGRDVAVIYIVINSSGIQRLMAQRYRERSMSKLPLLFAIALFVCPMTNSLWALERVATPDPNSQQRPYPEEAHITFQWNYSCPNHGCTFFCPGTGGASRVTKLDMYLGRIPDETDSHALYYSFATEYAPNGTGFSLGGKLTPLACQIIGMRLDYAGPPKGNSSLTSQN